MVAFPCAKINIGLNIVAKRPDGFHNIESVFYPIGLSDVVEAVPTNSGIAMGFSGIPIPGEGNDNLCVQAYHMLAADHPLGGVQAHLHKVIPIGAGLGGGSADASFFIQLLDGMFGLGLSVTQQRNYAARLGSDCPFFIDPQPTYVTGRGEVLNPIALDLSGYYLVLVYPGIHVTTAEAYAGIVPTAQAISLPEKIAIPVEEWQYGVANDFEQSIFKQYPEIAAVKDQLYAKGAVYAAMSGSGSSVYGLFHETTDLRECFPNYQVWQELL